MSLTNEQMEQRLRESLQTLAVAIDKFAAASLALQEAGRAMQQLNALMWDLHDQAAIREGDHLLYKDGDLNTPKSIVDRDGRVTLGLCRLCGAAEADLTKPCPGPIKKLGDKPCG